MAEEPNPRAFKHAIDADVVRRYAKALDGPDIDTARFIAAALDGLEGMELKDRVRHISRTIFRYVGEDFARGLALLLPMLDETNTSEGPSVEFAYWPLAQFVEDHGVDHIDLALPAMKAITRHFSCEFAVRPFLVRHEKRMLAEMHIWATDSDVHVRRNASEGLRPRLPWGMRLPRFIADPTPVLAVLEHLRHDAEPYVRRSVANCLNDIAKDHPGTVLEVLARWDEDADDNSAEIKARALRTLVKTGDARALALLGFGAPEVRVEDLEVDRDRYTVGDTLTLSFTLVSTASAAQSLVVDYRVHFVKKNGTRRPKVFKLTTVTLQPGESKAFTRRQHLKPITTRRYHAGTHALDVQVNGIASEPVHFELAT